MPVGSIDTQHSEASRKQYILVWVLNSILTTLITFVPDQILSELAQSLVQVSNIYIASITINLVEVLMHFLILIFVYAIFKNIFIQRVMPYFLISGVLSFLVMAGKAVNELGAIYFSKELILIDITSCLLFILLIFLFYSKMFPRKYFAPNLNGVRLEARREPTFKR